MSLQNFRYILRVGAGFGLCAASLVIQPLHAQPCPVTWGSTFQISNTSTPAFVPKLAVVGDTVHVVYLAGAMHYRRSTDGGLTWGNETDIVPADSMAGQIWNRPFAVTGTNLYFVWGNSHPTGAITSIKMRRSIDAGETWLAPQVLAYNGIAAGYSAPMVAALHSNVSVVMDKFVSFGDPQWFMTSSRDGGEVWDSIRQITFSQYNSSFGPYGDFWQTESALHLTFERDVQPSGREIVYTRSTDLGMIWGSLEILSTIDNYQAWEPNVAANDNGSVYISWQDAKYGSIGGFAGTVLLRRSTDNGQTWLAEAQVSSLPSARNSSLSVDGIFVHAAWDDERMGFEDGTIQYCGSSDGGTTWCSEVMLGGPLRRALNTNVVSVSEHVYAVWSSDRSVSGDTAQVFLRGGDIITNVDQTHGAIQESFIVAPPYPNPFNHMTTLEYSTSSQGPVVIKVFDNLGRTISTLFEGPQVAGYHEITLDGSEWASGVYHVWVRHGNTHSIRNVVLIR